jgi:uncharacterized protein
MPGSPTDDLRWLLTSPPIFAQLRGIELMPRAARERIASALDDGAGVVVDAPESHAPTLRRAPLGHRAEHLLARALAQCPGIDLIAERLSIQAGERTIGEIDLLYDDHERACRVHCEMSVRILLQREPMADASAWCGTDPRQTLQDKIDRLRDHQLPLGQHLDVPRHPTWPTVSEALVLGWLLQPAGEQWPDTAGAAPDHLRGWWLRHGIAEPLRSSRAARFALIPSQDWLGPLELPSSTPVLAPGELSRELDRHFARHDHAVLVAEVIRAQDGGWQEIARGAIVHRHWPKRPGSGR